MYVLFSLSIFYTFFYCVLLYDFNDNNTTVHAASANKVDQNHLQSEMAEAQSHIFEFPSIHVHSVVL